MSNLVERLRVRSNRKHYNIDESDDDADLLPRKRGETREKFERIVRSDAVSYILPFFSNHFYLIYFAPYCTHFS